MYHVREPALEHQSAVRVPLVPSRVEMSGAGFVARNQHITARPGRQQLGGYRSIY